MGAMREKAIELELVFMHLPPVGPVVREDKQLHSSDSFS
jgi:hypothetical protein